MNQVLPISARTAGEHIREWRQRRRLSQLDFSLDAGISQKHLSFIETGRAQASREMLLLLAHQLGVPLRDRNLILLAGGFAPVFGERRLDDPALKPARDAIDLVLRGHEPYPAIAVDRLWTLIAHNRAVEPLLKLAADERLLAPPLNVLRLSLSPGGLAPHIANLAEWRRHILERLRGQVERTADPDLIDLLRELQGMTEGAGGEPDRSRDFGGVLVPMLLRTPAGQLSLFSTTTVFGTPSDITLSELMLEAFYPADEHSARILKAMAVQA